jgi:hypothetical protein
MKQSRHWKAETVGYETHPLIRFLREPDAGLRFTSSDWESLLRAARRGYLSSRIAYLADSLGLIDQLAQKVRFHLRCSLRVAQSQARSINWEVRKIQEALSTEAIPFVVLKGAAYIKKRLSAGNGRLMSDVDIMVPHDRLLDAEKALFEHGWFPTKLNAYDQRYYRTWMHELPPMQHLDRSTTIDLHHTILPPTALLKPDASKLWQSAVPLEGDPGIFVLAPVDMVLHSAVHLFHDGELEHGLRDLVDIDALIRQFSNDKTFWAALVARAIELDLIRPLYYALKFCKRFLQTPFPEGAYTEVRRAGRPSAPVDAIMEIAIGRSIGAILENRQGLLTGLSQFSMYVRSHYLRMPLRLLIPHLLRKQFVRETGGT